MNNIQTANTIKLICKQKSISIAQMLKDCEITKSFIYDLEKRNTSPSCDKLFKIADYLDCSIDYLLGRTNEPKTISGNSIKTGDITGDNNANMNFSHIKQKEDEEDSQELLNMIKKLSIVQKSEIILKINEMLNQK